MSSNIQIEKVCQWCGKNFIARTTQTEYCSKRCAEHAYKDRKRKEKMERCKEEVRRVQTGMKEIDEKEFLTPRQAAQYLGLCYKTFYIYINKGDHGYTPNFENALRNAHGDYIFLSDQDDIWMPDKVEACMKYLKVNDFVVSDALIVDGDNKPLFDSFCEQRKSKFGFLNTLIRFSYLGCCFAFRRKVLSKALPFPKNHILCTHDNWLALVSTAFYKSAFIPLPLIRYRRYGGNASSGAKNANKSILFMIHYRLYLLFHLIGRCLVAK